MLKIKETREMYVVFNFGGYVYMNIDIYEGLSLNECLKMESEDIKAVIIDGLYIKIS